MTDDADAETVRAQPASGRPPEADDRPGPEEAGEQVDRPSGVVTDPGRADPAAADRNLFLTLARDLAGIESREAVERSLCERFADADRYTFAWVGERSLRGDRIAVRTHAGEEDGRLDAVAAAPDGPWRRALETGDLQVATVDRDGRPAAAGDGTTRVVAVPLERGGTVHGVLVVYARHPGVGGERERVGLETVGRTAGAAVSAGRYRELLVGEGTVELDVRLRDRTSFLVAGAADHDCTLTVAGQVATDGAWLVYCDVDGADADAVARTVGDHDAVERCRVVGDGAGGCRLELACGESSVLRRVHSLGASLRSAVADPDGCRLVVELPRSAEVRGVAACLQAAGAELQAQRDSDGPPEPPGVAGGALANLTDRQRTVLETAYRAGYFEWPRESTAEEVAASLDLATPTVLGHLRKAENHILSALLD